MIDEAKQDQIVETAIRIRQIAGTVGVEIDDPRLSAIDLLALKIVNTVRGAPGRRKAA